MATKNKATTTAKTKTAKAKAEEVVSEATAKVAETTALVAEKVEKVAKQVADRASDVAHPPIPEGELSRLRKMNLWLALVFAVQAVVIVAFGGSAATPITTTYQAVNELASEAAGYQVLDLATRHLFDMRLSIAAAKPLAVLALTCLIIATIGRAYYETQLRRGSHLARWLGFGLGGGLLVVALAQVAGVTDLAALGGMFALTAIGFSLEPLAERMKRQGKGVVGHALCAAATTAVVLPWLALVGSVAGSMLWDGHVMKGYYVMLGTTALFFGCWALAAHFRVRRQGKWADTLYTEKMYMFLTLAASSLLAWQIFAEAL
jgi:hypothetical protein